MEVMMTMIVSDISLDALIKGLEEYIDEAYNKYKDAHRFDIGKFERKLKEYKEEKSKRVR